MYFRKSRVKRRIAKRNALPVSDQLLTGTQHPYTSHPELFALVEDL